MNSVLITGCSSGIGLCVAEGLAKRGYHVFASARRLEDVENLRGKGFDAVQLDLADSDSIRAALAHVVERTGGTLDVLFNNGAYGQPGAVEDLRREVLREQFEVNLFGTHELTVEAIRIMRRQGHGRIIMNSSVLGLVSLPFRGAYAATKFALEGLTDTLRLELNGSGIHVSLIEPGPITSRFRANSMAKYKEHIAADASHFRETYAGMEARLKKQGPAAPFTLGPEAVLEKVVHAIESRKPKARYYVTFPTYLFAFLRRILSHGALDAFLLRISRGENANR